MAPVQYIKTAIGENQCIIFTKSISESFGNLIPGDNLFLYILRKLHLVQEFQFLV